MSDLQDQVLRLDTKHEMIAYVQGYMLALELIRQDINSINPAMALVVEHLLEAGPMLRSLEA